MKRILINATHNEEIRVALCKDNHLYDFDLENRTREQKKSNIYKGHITRVEPSLEAAFVEYGSAKQGFLPLREIAPEYLKGDRNDNIKSLLKEGDEVIVQVEKEERGNKGAALSTYISLAGRYLVLMPNNSKGGGISRQISGKMRDEMRQILANLTLPKDMSVIVRTAGIGKTYEDLQNDLDHLLETWQNILEQNRTRPSPCLVHQEAGVVTRAVRDYLRDDIGEVWIDSENAYNEAANFIASVMPTQMGKLRKYTDFEPMFAAFGIERQIESAYQREVRLPSGGSIVIDQTEALVSIDINSAKSTKGSDVAETAYHTNLEAADEIARQLRLRDMGGLIVIDFIDMNETRHQKEVEKRLIEATRYDRARVQFAEISKFGLMEMSRQRLRPSLEESTGYLCPRCHGNGMIRDLRSLALSIMRQIEQIALKERFGEIQAEVPTEIAAFLLNEKRESLVYLEQDSGVRVTILPHAHLESPNFSLHFNPDGFAPASYERIIDVEEQLNIDRGYDVNWHTENASEQKTQANHWQGSDARTPNQKSSSQKSTQKPSQPSQVAPQPQAVAWLSNLFAPKPSASIAATLSNNDVAAAIESIVNGGGVSLGSAGQLGVIAEAKADHKKDKNPKHARDQKNRDHDKAGDKFNDKASDKTSDKRDDKFRDNDNKKTTKNDKSVKPEKTSDKSSDNRQNKTDKYPKREQGSQREPRGEIERLEALTPNTQEHGKKTEELTEKVTSVQDKKAEKPTKPKQEFSVAIVPVAQNITSPDTVHVSLDDSKPVAHHAEAVPSNESVTSPNDEATTQKSELATDNAPDLDHTNLVPQVAEIDIANSDTQAKTLDTNAQADHVQSDNTQTNPAQLDAAVNEAQAHDMPVNVAQNAQADDTQAKTNRVSTSQENSVAPQDVAPLITSKPTFARLTSMSEQANTVNMIDDTLATAIATKMGLVKNDPRVVKAALSGTQTTAITGTAGEFIRQHLADSDTRLANGEFIACFIEALTLAKTQNVAPLHFANYGYGALPSDYLHAFGVLTQATSEYGINAGKTAVSARPIGKRASNDPRGQHPEYLRSLDQDTQSADTQSVNQVAADTPEVSAKKAELTPEITEPQTETGMIDTVVSTITDVAQEWVANINEMIHNTVSSETNDTSPEVINAQETVITNDHNDPDDAGTKPKSTNKKSGVKPKKPSSNSDDGQNSNPEADMVRGIKKSTIKNYKNMIENIAEQLLPQQTGLLTLAVPKPVVKPKTKISKKVRGTASSKPKAEVVKRPKAEDSPSDTTEE